MSSTNGHSYSTRRLYATVQARFDDWCREQGLRHPVPEEEVARYLRVRSLPRGRWAPRSDLSAIRDMYHDRGWYFDTKYRAIQRVLERVR